MGRKKIFIKKTFFILILAIFVISFLSFAKGNEQTTWSKSKGIYGGEIDEIAFSPEYLKDQTLFAGGPEGLYMSVDKGSTWKRLLFAFAEGVNSIAISPNYAQDHTIIVGTKSGIYGSKDSGNSWFTLQRGVVNNYIVQIGSDSNNNYFALSFDGILMEKTAGNDIWQQIGTFKDPLANTFTISNNTIYLGGEQGSIYKLDLQTKSSDLLVNNLTEGAISAIKVMGSTIYASSYDGGIFISKDSKNFTNELPKEKIADIEVTANGVIYAVTSYGGLRVKDSSGWENYNIPVSSTNLSIKLTPDFPTSGILFITSYEYGIIKSSDFGKTFSVSNIGITNVNITDVSFSRNYPTNSTVYLTTLSNGIYLSKNGGDSFEYLGSIGNNDIVKCIEELSNSMLIVGTAGDGIYYSKDGGSSFTHTEFLKNSVINFVKEINNGKIIIGTKDNGAYMSDLNLINATKIEDGVKGWDSDISNFANFKTLILLGTNGGDLYISYNNGENFTEIDKNSFGGLSITGLAISPSFDNDKTILVGTSGGIYISRDGGDHFIIIPDLLGVWADGCAISPRYNDDSFMVVGAWQHVYISNSKGTGFQDVYSNIDNRYVNKIVLSPDFEYMKSGSIFVLTNSGGIFRLKQTPKITIKMTIDKKGMLVNDKFIDTDAAPVIINNRTLVPIRFVSEALGANVQWFDKDKKVLINLKNTEISLFIGNPKAYVNGKEVLIDSQNLKVVPVIIGGRTFVPIRFVSESLGAKVEWDPLFRQVIITMEG
jgi:photosystem II stability/assembly factor-like uncharacterized protein